MVRPADRAKTAARMAELRAIGPSSRSTARSTLDRAASLLARACCEDHGVLVRPELLTALGVAVGDQIVIGQAPFTIRGVIENEPGRRVGDFSLGPRMIIDAADLESTGLLTFGSRARRVMLVKLPEARIEPLVRTLRGT